MKTVNPISIWKFLISILHKFSVIFRTKCKLLTGVAVILIVSSSCIGLYKSVKIAREKLKTYEIPEALYKDEWGMKTYKLYNPVFYAYKRQFKDESKNEYKLSFRRWCKGKDELGNTVKKRFTIFFNIKRFDNDTYEVSEVAVEKVFPLKLGRQFLTWLGLAFCGLIILSGWGFGNSADSTTSFWIFQVLWYIYVGIISYHCFMSGWGILLGILLSLVLSYFIFQSIKK